MGKRGRESRAGGGLAAGDEVEAEVERILPGGVGLAHARGQTLLVSLAAPGDRARVRVVSVRGRVAFASITQILSPSPDRVEPPCPYFGRCGGCDFQQLSYPAQLAAKAEIIRDCLRRVAGVEPPAPVAVEPSPAEWRYRSRARWQHDPLRRQLGYYERGTRRVCDVVACPVAAPPLQEKLTALRELLRRGELPEEAAEFEAVAGDDGVSLLPPLAEGDRLARRLTAAGESYGFDASCFFQINHTLLDALVREGVGDAAGELALDLYSGVGLFTLPLARRFRRVVGVEGHAGAAAFARRNLADAGLTNAEVEASPVGPWMKRNADRFERGEGAARPDFVLLDPPRTGAEPEAVEALTRLRPAHVSYVSCDPATLARDLKRLLTAGYRLASVRAFDMFPQTHHVETVVHLAAGV